MSEWRETAVRDLCVAIVDCVNKTAPVTDSPTRYKMLRTTNVRDGWVDTVNVRYVSQATYERWTRRLKPARGDVILTREAPLGEVGLLRSDDEVFLGQRLVMYRADSRVCDNRFLMYSMLGPTVQAELRSLGSGATVEHLRVPDCEKLTIPCPSLETQVQIGETLGALDDLIENNRRRIELLESMARAIYREWFVHFRFPGHEDVKLVDSDLGPIPEGWDIVPLGDLASITMGQSPKSEYYNTDGIGEPFHQGVAEFGEHFPTTRKWCTTDGRRAYTGDVLLSVRAPVGRINLAGSEMIIGRGLAALRSKTDRQALLLSQLKHVFAEEDSMGGGTIFKAIGKKELADIRAFRPSNSVAEEANNVFSDNIDLIKALTFENRRLAALRDVLLPKLVSGQIDVSGLDLDAVISEAVG